MITFPENDTEFTEDTIDSVEQQSDGTYVITIDGWSLWCRADCLIIPQAGQIARRYGRGLGFRVRGLFIDGEKIWYRTTDEDLEDYEVEVYGRDAADWLARWDRGETVWSISMGGLGPGYEQCIHIICAEVVRWFVEQNADAALWDDKDVAKPIFDRMEKDVFKVPSVDSLGLTGAQWGAARNLAAMLYRWGPRAVMKDERVKDRHIQVCRMFP